MLTIIAIGQTHLQRMEGALERSPECLISRALPSFN